MGTGPSAAGAALALVGMPSINVTILDVGGELEAENAQVRTRMSTAEPGTWRSEDLEIVAPLPRNRDPRSLPRKQICGSNFPFDDFGQLSGVSAKATTNNLLVSGAYGGFSNIWGAQVMPWSTQSFRDWPLSRSEMEPHYREILSHIPYAGVEDDLEEFFPLFGIPSALPKIAERSQWVLDRYGAHRMKSRRYGVTFGAARLAFDAPSCRRCGLCMSGCPYQLIYSASQTISALRAAGHVKYLPNLRVDAVRETDGGQPKIYATSVKDGSTFQMRADKVLLGAGAIGSTRIAANSLGRFNANFSMHESAQFVTPFLSKRPTATLQQSGEFTLNQFNIYLQRNGSRDNSSLIHCYPYNDIMMTSLPKFLSSPSLGVVARRAMRHLTVGLGYLPSWASPSLAVRVGSEKTDGSLPDVEISGVNNPLALPTLRDVTARLRKIGVAIDLFPLPGQTKLSGPAKSYHFGGSFPHANDAMTASSSDLLGRPIGWRNTHLIDGSVFPTIAATTFTLTIMANAHRIASEIARVRTT